MTLSTPTLLPDRCLVRVSGADAQSLLQGLLTCNMETIAMGQAAWGFLLTPQGRFLHDMFVINTEDGLYLDTAKASAALLLKRLKMFTLRSDAQFTLLDDWAIAASSAPLAASQASISLSDPRHSDMGLRHYLSPVQKQTLATAHHDDAHHTQRLALGIPSADDFVSEKTLLLDYDVDALHGIDFHKGCYVGQEVTARMHYRSLRKKGLYIIHADDHDAPLPHGEAVMAGEQEAGTMLSSQQATGIAVLRHALASQPLTCAGTTLRATRPSWANNSDAAHD